MECKPGQAYKILNKMGHNMGIVLTLINTLTLPQHGVYDNPGDYRSWSGIKMQCKLYFLIFVFTLLFDI